MAELILHIRPSDNGNIIVNKLIKEATIMTKAEYKVYTFANMKELSNWLEKNISGGF